MTDKVIVTNMSALKVKYNAAGIKSLQTEIKALIDEDKKRGLTTSLVALDDTAAMKKLKAPPVKKATSFRENKKAIDAVYKALVPDYLMILGAIDVIPHQDLNNPLFSPDPEGDNEETAWGDLPYACDAPYSKDINDFTGPTRVVGRLPDLTGQTDPKYLIGLLKTASSWKGRPRSDYENYLGISAEKWSESTEESLTNIFGSDKDIQLSPTKGFKWSKNLINRRIHFVNCHGGDLYPFFLGQSSTDDDDMPVSHSAAFLARSEEHTSELQSLAYLVCRLLLEKKKKRSGGPAGGEMAARGLVSSVAVSVRSRAGDSVPAAAYLVPHDGLFSFFFF